MELKTYYKQNGKEYAKSFGTEKEVNADDKTVTIDGVVYKLRHASIKKEETELAPRKGIKLTKKKTYKRKK